MAKLNQIIAIEKGIKSKSHSEISEIYKVVQKPVLFNGFAKTYHPLNDEETEKLPAERQRVQMTYKDALRRMAHSMGDLIQTTARKDWTNCEAMADVMVKGKGILFSVPVPFLLFMEKQLTDLRTFVAALPALDEAEEWAEDVHSGLMKTDVVKTHRTKKIAKAIVKYPATPEHPAQTEMVTEDIIAGFWHMIKHSGAMPKPEKEDLLKNIDDLHNAIKQAREQANMCEEVKVPNVATTIFDFLLLGLEE